MFSHIQLGARDLTSMIAFYEAVLAPLGLERMPDEDDGGPAGAGWQRPGNPATVRRFLHQISDLTGTSKAWA